MFHTPVLPQARASAQPRSGSDICGTGGRPMTSTAAAARTRTGRSLVDCSEFETLAAFCAAEYGLERCVADRVVDQALAFVFVMGSSGDGASMAPSMLVDPGWHTLILHTSWYADWCERSFGYFLKLPL
ncbi:hypothetical protein [Streptomyces sp. NPDC002491]